MAHAHQREAADGYRPKPWNDPRVRGLVAQGALLSVIAVILIGAATNAHEKMVAHGVPTGFSFWDDPARFDINQTLIPYSATSANSQVFWVGLINTLVVAVSGVVLASLLGFAIGRARLSKNWLISCLATFYIEAIRNVPLLLQLLFWINAVLLPLPAPSKSLTPLPNMYLNNRGLFFPAIKIEPGAALFVAALAAALVGAWGVRLWARRRQAATGQGAPVGWIALGLLIALPALAALLAGPPLAFSTPVVSRFNISNAFRLSPELVSLVLGLSVYTAAFIAEIVRAGYMSVPRGQSEAAAALGLRPNVTRRLVIQPQAMRVIIPPLVSQYLNLTKNSTLAIAIGYPDLFSVFTGTVLNNTGATVQIILITMAVYLTFSLTTSAIMNVYNARMALRER